MASLSEIRTALAATIKAGVASQIYVYGKLSDLTNVPAVVIEPADADYAETMNTSSKWFFTLYVLTSRAEVLSAQEKLDALISDNGPDSIRRAIRDTPGLGLPDGAATAMVLRMRGYGGSMKFNGIPFAGAVLQAVVHTDGSP